jgi:4-hydroxy-tetrahydrodipicolinate synthase
MEIRGVMVPILTPLTSDERVDVSSLRRLVNYLIDNGVHGIWASGSNGEFPALSDGERLTSIEVVVDEAAGRVPVIANVSLPSTRLTVELGLAARAIGMEGIAATPPYYFPHAQDEIADHFRYIQDRVGLPLWVYNIPPMVKTAVAPATVADLAAEGVVVGVKDSSGAGEALAELNFLCDQRGLRVYRFLGSVNRIATCGAVGAHGAIPGLGNLVPRFASKAWEAGEAGDAEAAMRWTAKLREAGRIESLARGGGAFAARLSGIKSALKLMGVIDDDAVTRPQRPLTPGEKAQIPPLLEELGLPVQASAAA